MTTLLLAALAFQIGSPGQYPPGGYPPGGYPPGQYPPGRNPGSQGPGIPFPRRGNKTTASEKKAAEEPTLHYTGKLRTFDEKSFEIIAADTRTLVFQIDDKTKKPADLAAGDEVAVDAREDDKGYYIAVSVMKTAPVPGTQTKADGTVAPAATAVEPESKPESGVNVLKGPKYDEGDEGAPKLKRGKPVARAKPMPVEEAPSSPAATTETSIASRDSGSGAPAGSAPDPRVAFIEEAKAASTGFLGSLPNFVCAQQTTRYVSEGKAGWQAVDVLAVDVVYEGGREKYEHLTINGKPSKKPAEESGAWSTGEFGTVLADLFSPSTAAKFRYSRTEKIAGFDASVYKFEVERPNSHWKIYFRSQWIMPAYRGSLWLEKKTARVLRIEMQATDVPKEFLADTTESAVNYEMVSLGSQKFLLPVHAEVLTCMRGTSTCDKNVIEFRNYHKFSGESTIQFAK